MNEQMNKELEQVDTAVSTAIFQVRQAMRHAAPLEVLTMEAWLKSLGQISADLAYVLTTSK